MEMWFCVNVEFIICANVILWECGYVEMLFCGNVYLCICGNIISCICGNVGLWIYGNVVLCEFYSPKKTRRTRILSACSSCYSLAFDYNQIVMSVVSLFHSSLTVMVMRWLWL